jgi:4-amino-4-deoxy-L-arabinose transferase-like glycosyltransferase
LYFLIFWMLFSYAVGRFEHFNSPPMGVHQSAQCDRASLAQNYFYNGFNLFYPEVNETRCTDGIVSCEFPIISYLSAISYQLFGYHEINFRIITFLLYTLGMWALFKWVRRYSNIIIASTLIVLFNSSPILLFYANNFIPDAASLGLALMAIYLFFKLHIKHPYIPESQSWFTKVAFILSLGLSIAIKTTALIHWVTILLVAILSYFPLFKIQLSFKKQLIKSLFLAISLPFAWYLWSRHLANHHNAEYFLMQIPKWNDWQTYADAWQIYLNNWPQQTFEIPILMTFLLGFIVQLFIFKKELSNLWLLSLINFIGAAAFLCLMMMQFRYHDYYIITLLPAFLFNWIYLLAFFKTTQSKYIYLKLALFILLLIGANFQFNSGKKNLLERYSAGNYWEQSHQNANEYIAFKDKIKPFNLDRNTCVLVGYDISPNNILYYLHLRGYRFYHDQSEEKLKSIIGNHQLEYIISNDERFEKQVKDYFNLKLLTAHQNIKLFKIETQ